MTAREFARAVAAEKKAMLSDYFASRSEASVARRMRALKLDASQRRHLRKILDEAMTDLAYTILLGLDGEASLGGVQQQYRLTDEKGQVLTGGDLEVAAYHEFHGRGT
jgi:hypothetical protein